KDPGINAYESQLTHVGIVDDLECQRTEGLVICGPSLHHLICIVRMGSRYRWNIQGRRQVVHHAVQELLDTFVLEGCTAKYRHELEFERALADSTNNRLRGECCISFEVAFRERIIELRNGFDQLPMRLRSFRAQLIGDLLLFELGAELLLPKYDCL